MSIALDRLLYITRDISQNTISSMTGIPQSTISYAVRGIKDVPRKHWDIIKSTYQRVVRADLSNLGVPSHQLARLVYKSPSIIDSVTLNFNLMVNDLTKGAIASKLQGTGEPTDLYTIKKYWDDTETAVREGLSQSKKPLEMFDDYGRELTLFAELM